MCVSPGWPGAFAKRALNKEEEEEEEEEALPSWPVPA